MDCSRLGQGVHVEGEVEVHRVEENFLVRHSVFLYDRYRIFVRPETNT